MAHQGFDSLTVDMQHGVVDYQVAVTMLQAISTTPVIPLARVPWNDPARLMKILDAGVYGVICPMINSRAQAEALVAACKYAPRGYRSWGPVGASIYAGGDYGDRANDDLIVMPMVETAEAVKNIDEILSVPGVDAVYVGPSDLSLTLGCKPRLDQTDPPVVEAQQRIVEACKRHGVVAGIHNATAAYALQMIAAGYQFVTLASDSRFLAAKAAEEVAAVRKTGVRAGKLPAYLRVTDPPPLRLDDALRARARANLAAFERRSLARDGRRPAAVALVLLDDDEGRACFLLTRRAASLRAHARQWALPGGRIDPGESAERAALRELREEVGLERDEPTVLGLLDDYGTRSGFIITPVVVWGGSRPALLANPAEVASVHRVPLADLDRPDVPRLVTIPESDRPVIQVPLLSTLVHAPTAAVLYQVREVVVHGRPTRVGRPWTTTSDRKSTRLN